MKFDFYKVFIVYLSVVPLVLLLSSSIFLKDLSAQNLYKYVDSSGSITYTSKKPVGRAYSLVTPKNL